MTGGAIGDRYGLRNVFAGGIAVFLLASAACAVAPDSAALIAARAAQGLGAAAMVPGSLAIIAKAYPEGDRARAIGIWAAASALTTALGPLLGGVLLSATGDWAWRIIFAINLPLGVVALALLYRVPADDPEPDRRLDVAGALIATAALALVAFGLTGGPAALDTASRAAPPADWLLVVAGLALLAGFVWWERRTANPMMPLSLFATPSFSGANIATLMLYFALSGMLFFLPMTLVTAWGLGEGQAALVFLPISVAVAVLSGPVGRVAGRTGPRPWMTAGSMLTAAGYALMAATMQRMDFWLWLMPAAAISAVGMGLLVSPLSVAVMTGIPQSQTGVASAVNNTVARMAGLLAAASLGSVVSAVLRATAGGGSLYFGEPPPPGASLESVDAWIAGSNAAFAAVAWICAGLSLAAAATSWLMLPRR